MQYPGLEITSQSVLGPEGTRGRESHWKLEGEEAIQKELSHRSGGLREQPDGGLPTQSGLED